MDAASPDYLASENNGQPPSSHAPSRFWWVWAPASLGAAAAIATLTIKQLAQAIQLALVLNNPFVYTHQPQFNAVQIAVDGLAISVFVVGIAFASAFRVSDARRRSGALARLLGALVLMVGIAWLQQVVTAAAYSALTSGQTAASSTAFYDTATNVREMIFSVAQGLLLGVTVALALRLSRPGIAPRQGYWMLAGGCAGIAAAFFTDLDRFLTLTVQAVRLASVGVTGCMGGSGAGCYGGQLLDIAYYSVFPLIIGAVVGAIIGGALAPDLATERPHAAVSSPAPATPRERSSVQAQGRRGWRSGSALRYLAGGAVGVLYIALVLALAYLASSYISGAQAARSNGDQPAFGLITFDILSLLIPAVWLALASAPGQGGKRALRWTLALFAATLAVAAPVLAILVQGVSFLDASPISPLAAFAFGAAYGLLWAPQPPAPRARGAWRAGVRAAATGWIGVSLPLVILLGFAFYSLITYTPPPNSCHSLGCGALLFLIFNSIIAIGVNIIVVGLPVALLAGGLSGVIREARRTA